MEKKWTEEQKRAVDLHNKNILVSAAAGSGKTAVLVERIVRMLTRESDPVDVERLVIVTFTNAAAAEMKERISAALEEMLESSPSDKYLQRQLVMLHIAQITTIDSFCLNILRNNYMNIDLDPGFRIADAGELELLKADVMETMLEEYYAGQDPEFYALIDAYSGKKSDFEIEKLINDIYDFARSYPWPEDWLDMAVTACRVHTAEEFDSTKAGLYLYNYITGSLQSFRRRLKDMLGICSGPAGPAMYIENITDDIDNLDMMLESRTFSEWARAALNVDFTDLSRKRGTGVDPDAKELVKTVRTQYKDTFRKMRDRLCRNTVWEYTDNIEQSAKSVQMLAGLVKRYMRDVSAAKREKNIIDFNDIEQMALRLLINRHDGEISYTALADELAGYYEEILIDEYQDSNYIQEQILTAVSRSRKQNKNSNIFMVGDVKQSIYKFRLARPDLFIEKYDSYNDTDDCEMIELRKNFRSRAEVLESINVLFEMIMQRECGGIEYTDNVRLNPGREFAAQQTEGRIDNKTLIRLVDTGDLSERSVNTPRELEGREIARIVKELTDEKTGIKVFDDSIGKYRNARFGDIVVLTRSVAGWADTFAGEMMNQGVPAIAQSSSGYYDTFEIEQILNVLAVIDNPIQDIPLTAVITSYFGTLTISRLARIRSEYKNANVYESLIHYVNAREEGDPETADISRFMEWLSGYRDKAEYLSISELIWQIIYDTGFYDYVGNMPAGHIRRINLDMLCDKAKSYEKTSYHGLFNFLRYIEKVKRFDLENTAQVIDSSVDFVQVMSIHKSKGLEFPIVIIAGMSKEFNNMDARGKIIVDSDIGIGMDVIDPKARTKMTTPAKTSVEIKIQEDNLAEEIRILYVAMTRAKEKLIMVGTVKNYERSSKKWSMSDVSSLAGLRDCHTYFDLVMPAAMKSPLNFQIEFQEAKEKAAEDGEPYDLEVNPEVADEIRENIQQNMQSSEHAKRPENTENPEHPEYTEYESYRVYAYEYAVSMKTKMSVSEIKHYEYAAQSTEEFIRENEPEVNIHNEEETSPPTVPKFISMEEEVKAAERGTAYHRVMECFDYGYADSLADVREFMDKMTADGLMTNRQREAVDEGKIFKFCENPLGQRVRKAFEMKKVYREKPFVMGIPASRIKCYQKLIDEGAVSAEKLDEETVLIQGVIDLFFEEDGKIILVDYKTDRVKKSNGARILTERYLIQLEYYAEALERVLGKKVSEKIIYSFWLDESISL